MNYQSLADRFLISRVFRRGSAKREDLIQAFLMSLGIEISKPTASRYMTETFARNEEILNRKAGRLWPKPLAAPPAYASEAQLLNALDNAIVDPLRTGFFDDELPIVRVSWTSSLPKAQGSLNVLARAIAEHAPVYITYQGMRAGQEYERKRILPLALEKMNDQWRVVGQSIAPKDLPAAPLRVYVLARILLVETDTARKPNGFVEQGHYDRATRVPVRLNRNLNDGQREVICRELNIRDDTLEVASRSLFEFKRRFTSTPPTAEAIWPPLEIQDLPCML